MQIDLGEISVPKKDGPKSSSVRSETSAAKLAACSKRYGDAKATIGKIEKGVNIHAVSEGEWSLHNTISHVIDEIGPCDLWVATWSISEDAVRQLVRMRLDGRVRKFMMLADWRVRHRRPEAAGLVRSNSDKVRVGNCHAKAAVLLNDEFSVSIVTSANLTNNPRTEVYVITEDEKIAAFHRTWIEHGIDDGNNFDEGVKLA